MRRNHIQLAQMIGCRRPLLATPGPWVAWEPPGNNLAVVVSRTLASILLISVHGTSLVRSLVPSPPVLQVSTKRQKERLRLK